MDPTDRSPLAAVAAHGLVAAAPTVPVEPLDEPAWRKLLAAARSGRLTGLLAAAVDAGSWPATDEQAEQAFAAQAEAMATVVRLEQLLLDVVDRLETEGISVRALKGSAHAHLDYPDPSWRSFGDVDLLVRAADVERARDVLLAAGGGRRYPEPRPGFDRRFGKGMCIVTPTGDEVDVHRTLCLGPFGLTIDLDELFAGSERFGLGGRELTALDPPRRFLHACVHAAAGRAVPMPAALRDVAQTVPGTEVGRADALALAERWQIGVLVRRAVHATARSLAWAPPPDLVATIDARPPSRLDRSRLATYTGGGRSSATMALSSVRAVRGVRGKAAYALAVAWPTKVDRTTRRTRWRHGVEAWRRRRGTGAQA